MNKQLDKITPRDVDFTKWYTDVVVNAGLIAYGPVKGTIIFKPYGYAIWENIQKYLDTEFKKHGVQNVYFPLLIPESLFLREKDHIDGFAPEIATVTRVGDKELEEPLLIRPTSEVLMMEHFKHEVHSYRDLPLVYNQWANVMRWEKTTRPFLRTSEFLWQEGHTVHANEAEARDLTLKILDVYTNVVIKNLALPVIRGRKTEKEKFAGAQETYTIECLMFDGQALQSGTSHYFGNNFTKAFDIKFQNKQNQLEYAYSTSWGASTRLIGAIIMTHSDDNGLVMPFDISPIQIRIIQVKYTPEIKQISQELKDRFNKYRVDIDNTDKTFGFKISEAEIKGIPIRIEIGPRDLEHNQVVISRRDNQSNKLKVKLEDVQSTVEEMIVDYKHSMYNKALQHREQRFSTANTISEYKEIIETKSGFVLVPFCGRIECEDDVKKQTSTNSRCIPFEVKQTSGKCFNCGQDSELRVYFARAY